MTRNTYSNPRDMQDAFCFSPLPLPLSTREGRKPPLPLQRRGIIEACFSLPIVLFTIYY
jgi:hypothetical protein